MSRAGRRTPRRPREARLASEPLLKRRRAYAPIDVLTPESEARVHVTGHTDRVGSKVYNQMLAGKRTAAVIEALKSMGVPSAWITGDAFGEENPISISRNPHDARTNTGPSRFECLTGISVAA